MNCLSLENIDFERDDVSIFRNLKARWESGDIVQIAGQNGSGKTTLLRIITGLITPQQGRVLWNNYSNGSFEFRSSLLYLGHQVGVKLTMTPLENLAWYFGLNGRKSAVNQQGIDGTQLSEALAMVGLKFHLDVPCYQLSAGQHRRVALARLYLSNAPLWILDEPFTAIDAAGVVALEERIDRHARQGGIVLLTTHQSWNSESMKVFDLSSEANVRVTA